MTLFKKFRRLFPTTAPLEIKVDPEGQMVVEDSIEPPVAPTQSLVVPDPLPAIQRLESTLQAGRDVQDRTLEAIKDVPAVASQLRTMTAGYDQVTKMIASLQESDQRRTENQTAVFDRLTDRIERETALFELIQSQLDANQQSSEKTSVRLGEVATAIHETSRINRVTGKAMVAMIAEIRDREKRAEDRAGVLQGWVITCVVACIAATAASIALAWAVLASTG